MKMSFGRISWRDLRTLQTEAKNVHMGTELQGQYTVLLKAYENAIQAEWEKAQALGVEILLDELVMVSIEVSIEPYSVPTYDEFPVSQHSERKSLVW
jgi:hypothetical protein